MGPRILSTDARRIHRAADARRSHRSPPPMVLGLRLAQRRHRLVERQCLQVWAHRTAAASHPPEQRARLMTLTLAEQQLLLQALDMATSRHQSQANFYEARPLRYATASVTKHQDKAAAMQALACRLSTLTPRRDVLEVA